MKIVQYLVKNLCGISRAWSSSNKNSTCLNSLIPFPVESVAEHTTTDSTGNCFVAEYVW